MKKFMTLMLGLSLVMGATAVFAQDAPKTDTTKKTKTKKAKTKKAKTPKADAPKS